MSQENKALIRRWFEEIWNQGNEATIDELLDPEAKVQGLDHPEGAGKSGPEAFKPFHRAFRNAFPDIHITLHEIIAEGDMVATRFTATGTHASDDLGIPATNRKIEVSGMSMGRIEGGKLVEGHNTVDLLTMYRQLDALDKI